MIICLCYILTRMLMLNMEHYWNSELQITRNSVYIWNKHIQCTWHPSTTWTSLPNCVILKNKSSCDRVSDIKATMALLLCLEKDNFCRKTGLTFIEILWGKNAASRRYFRTLSFAAPKVFENHVLKSIFI